MTKRRHQGYPGAAIITEGVDDPSILTAPGEYCFECTKDIDSDGDCFECGSGKFARDCTCLRNDWLCPYHQGGYDCTGVVKSKGTC